jgi:hypothetical protein
VLAPGRIIVLIELCVDRHDRRRRASAGTAGIESDGAMRIDWNGHDDRIVCVVGSQIRHDLERLGELPGIDADVGVGKGGGPVPCRIVDVPFAGRGGEHRSQSGKAPSTALACVLVTFSPVRAATRTSTALDSSISR